MEQIDRILAKREAFGAPQGLVDGLTKDERIQLAHHKQVLTLRRLLNKEAAEAIALQFSFLNAGKALLCNYKALTDDLNKVNSKNKALTDDLNKVKKLYLDALKEKKQVATLCTKQPSKMAWAHWPPEVLDLIMQIVKAHNRKEYAISRWAPVVQEISYDTIAFRSMQINALFVKKLLHLGQHLMPSAVKFFSDLKKAGQLHEYVQELASALHMADVDEVVSLMQNLFTTIDVDED